MKTIPHVSEFAARCFRLALIALIALGCVRAGRSIVRLQRPAPADTPAETAARPKLPPLALGPVDGYWKFAAGDLRIPSELATVGLSREQLAQLIETPPSKTGDDGITLIEHPPGASRVCSRWTHDDRLAMELLVFDPPLPAAALVEHWQAAGWTVESTPLDKQGDFSVMCGQADRIVSAWSAGGRDGIETLILVNAAMAD